MPIVGSIGILAEIVGGEKVIQQVKQIQQAAENAGKTNVDIKFDNKRYDEVVAGITNVGNALVRVGGSWDAVLGRIGKFSQALEHAGQIAASFAYRLALLTIPLDAIAGKAIKFASDFEASLVKVATQLTGTTDELERFTQTAGDQIVELSKKYGTSAKDISEALYFLVSSGVQQDLATQLLEPITKLATVGGAQAKDVAQAMTAAFNVFGDQLKTQFPDAVERANYVAELMFETIRKGRFDVTDFSTQFGRAAEQVKLAGGDIAETSALLASLSQVFTPSQAVTALNSFAKAIVNPTKEAKDAIKELEQIIGHDLVFAFDKATGAIIQRDLKDILVDIFTPLKEIAKTDMSRALEFLNAIFGEIRGGRAAQFLINADNFETFLKLLDPDNPDGITGRGDTLAKGWEITERTLKNTFDRMQATFDGFAYNIVNSRLTPALKGIFEGLIGFMDKVLDNKEIVNVLTNIGAALAVLSPIALLLGTALLGAGGLVGAVAALLQPTALIALAFLFEKLSPAIKDATKAINEFGGGINGVVGFVTELARQLGLIDEKTAIEVFKQLGITVTDIAKSDVSEVTRDLTDLFKFAMDAKDAIVTIANGIGTLIENISRGEGILGKFYTTIKGVMDTLGQLTGLTKEGGFTPENIADKLDKVIGAAVALKIAGYAVTISGTVMEWLKRLGIVNMQAGVVNIQGGVKGLLDDAKGLLLGGGGTAAGGGTISGGTSGVLAFLTSAAGIAAITATVVAVYTAVVGKIAIDKGRERLEEQGINPQNATFSQTFYAGLNKWADDLFKTLNDFGANIATVWEVAKHNINQWADNLWLQIEDAGNKFAQWIADVPNRLRDIYALAIGLSSGQIQASISKWLLDSSTAVGQAIYSAVVQFLAGGGFQNAVDNFFANFGFASPIPADRSNDLLEAQRARAGAQIGQIVPIDFSKLPDTRREDVATHQEAIVPLAKVAQEAGQQLSNTVYKLGGMTYATEAAANAAKKFAEAMYSAAGTIIGSIKGFVEQALTPTEIGQAKKSDGLTPSEKTPEQQANEIDKLTNAWDRFRLKLEQVNSIQDVWNFGEKFVEQVKFITEKFPQFTQQQIVEKFKNFSLFADLTPAEINKIVDFAPIEEQVKQKIDELIGKFKVVREGIANVLGGLSAEKIVDLGKALGITDINPSALREQLQVRLTELYTGVSQDPSKLTITPEVVTTKAKQSFDKLKEDGRNARDDIQTPIVPKVNPAPAIGAIQIIQNVWNRLAESMSQQFVLKVDTSAAIQAINDYIEAAKSIPINPFDIIKQITEGNPIFGENPPPTEPPPTYPEDKEKKAGGGYAWKDSIYRLGEMGREYVLSAGNTAKLEQLLGGMISSPAQIEHLIGGMARPNFGMYPLQGQAVSPTPRSPNQISIGNVYNSSPQDGDRLMSQLSWLGIGL